VNKRSDQCHSYLSISGLKKSLFRLLCVLCLSSILIRVSRRVHKVPDSHDQSAGLGFFITLLLTLGVSLSPLPRSRRSRGCFIVTRRYLTNPVCIRATPGDPAFRSYVWIMGSKRHIGRAGSSHQCCEVCSSGEGKITAVGNLRRRPSMRPDTRPTIYMGAVFMHQAGVPAVKFQSR
jgi:hypothetical protein